MNKTAGANVEREANVEWFATLSVSEVLRSLWKHRYSICLTTVVLALFFATIVFFVPVKYDSDAQLLVKLGRGTISTDPTSGSSPSVSVQETRLSQVSSVKEMLQSRALADKVVQRIGAERILEPHGFTERTIQWLTSWIPSAGGGGGAGGGEAGDGLTAEETEAHLVLEEAIRKLQDNLEISTTKTAYTIYVRVRTGTPYLSRDLLKAIVELYQEYHVHAYHSGGTLPFFESETEKSHALAVDAKESVRRAKDSMGIIEIESSRAALREQLTQAQRELDQVAVELASTDSEVTRYEAEMRTMPERVKLETITGITSSTGDGMRQQLYQLEMQAKDLASKLREDHPQLKAIRDQLEAATKIAGTERKEQPQNRESVNPVYQQFEISYRNALVRQDGLKAKRESLRKQLLDLNDKILQLNKNEVELTKLTWEATLAENVYLQNAQSRDKAKLLDALDREGLSEISIVQPASLQLKKASPKRGFLLVAAAMMAAGLGVLQALVRTVLTKSHRQAVIREQEESMAEEISLTPRLVTEVSHENHSEAAESSYARRMK